MKLCALIDDSLLVIILKRNILQSWWVTLFFESSFFFAISSCSVYFIKNIKSETKNFGTIIHIWLSFMILWIYVKIAENDVCWLILPWIFGHLITALVLYIFIFVYRWCRTMHHCIDAAFVYRWCNKHLLQFLSFFFFSAFSRYSHMIPCQ